MRLWPRRHGTSYDLLVAGLGNPGREYARNRHNVGWLVVDELARRHDGSWRAKFNGKLAEIRIDGHKVALLKPETYMNDSGRSVKAAMQFFKLEPDAVLVVHDESDLPLGRLQARLGGGTAGHNGVRSVADASRHPGLPAPARRRRAARDAAIRARSPTACSPTSPPHEDAERAGRERQPTRSRCSTPRGSRRLSAPSTRSVRNTRHAIRTSAGAQRKRAPAGRKGRLTRV